MEEANNHSFHNLLLKRILELSKPMQPEKIEVDTQLADPGDVHAILFDVYGTLLTCGLGENKLLVYDKQALLRNALQDTGFTHLTKQTAEQAAHFLSAWIENTHRRMREEGTEYPEVDIQRVWEHVLRYLVREGLIAGCVNEQTIQRIAVEYECRINPVWPMPELETLLNGLRKRELKVGIISNAQFYTPLVLEAFSETGWADGFFDPELCIWSWQYYEAKPSLALYQTLLKRLNNRYGILPEHILFIGNDMLNDITPAARLGCQTALFAGDRKSLNFRANDLRCAGIHSDSVITRLPQLLSLLS